MKWIIHKLNDMFDKKKLQSKLVYDMKTGSEIINEYSQISCFVNVSQILYLVTALIPEHYNKLS